MFHLSVSEMLHSSQNTFMPDETVDLKLWGGEPPPKPPQDLRPCVNGGQIQASDALEVRNTELYTRRAAQPLLARFQILLWMPTLVLFIISMDDIVFDDFGFGSLSSIKTPGGFARYQKLKQKTWRILAFADARLTPLVLICHGGYYWPRLNSEPASKALPLFFPKKLYFFVISFFENLVSIFFLKNFDQP